MAHGSQTIDSLRIHRAVLAVAGPKALADITAPLTADERELLDEALADLGTLQRAGARRSQRHGIEQ